MTLKLMIIMIIPKTAKRIIYIHQEMIFCLLLTYWMLVNHFIFLLEIKNKFNVRLNIHYKTTKASIHFQLKCANPFELSVNVVYKFTCPCDTTLSCAGYAASHLVAKTGEHLNFNFATKSAIKDHVYCSLECISKHFSVNDFTVLKIVILIMNQKFKKH